MKGEVGETKPLCMQISYKSSLIEVGWIKKRSIVFECQHLGGENVFSCIVGYAKQFFALIKSS